ncbi:MAG: hypothetical protein R3C10_21610 [Pirellulales bacterium]|nr:hypothetical protein [Planctomycetales bacterium]
MHAELVSERRDGLTATLQRWADNRLFVVGVLLVVGPLGLPLIWVSRRLSLGAKIAWTVVFVLFTVVLPIALVWYCCDVLLQPLLDAFEQQRSL